MTDETIIANCEVCGKVIYEKDKWSRSNSWTYQCKGCTEYHKLPTRIILVNDAQHRDLLMMNSCFIDDLENDLDQQTEHTSDIQSRLAGRKLLQEAITWAGILTTQPQETTEDG